QYRIVRLHRREVPLSADAIEGAVEVARDLSYHLAILEGGVETQRAVEAPAREHVREVPGHVRITRALPRGSATLIRHHQTLTCGGRQQTRAGQETPTIHVGNPPEGVAETLCLSP